VNPRFYLDQDVNKALKRALQAYYPESDCEVTAAESGLHLAYDGHHLLHAAQNRRILVSHNGKDFITMHDAWARWSAAWGVAPQRARHYGILIIPQSWRPPVAAREISQFLGPHDLLPDQIYAYDTSPDVQQWVKDPTPKRR